MYPFSSQIRFSGFIQCACGFRVAPGFRGAPGSRGTPGFGASNAFRGSNAYRGGGGFRSNGGGFHSSSRGFNGGIGHGGGGRGDIAESFSERRPTSPDWSAVFLFNSSNFRFSMKTLAIRHIVSQQTSTWNAAENTMSFVGSEVQFKMEHVVDPVTPVNEADVISNYDVAVARGWWAEPPDQVPGHGTNTGTHIGSQHESLANIGLPFMVPIATFIVSKGLVMIAVPVTGYLMVMIVKSVMIMMVPIAILPSGYRHPKK